MSARRRDRGTEGAGVAKAMPVSGRVARLRAAACAPRALDGWLEVERLRAGAFARAAGLPSVRRQAALFVAVLAELPIRIEPGELIVGSQDACFSKSYDLYLRPAVAASPPLPDGVEAYHRRDPYNLRLATLLTPAERAAADENVCIGKRVSAHAIPDFAAVIAGGLEAVIARAERALADGPADTTPRERLHAPADFYRAVIQCARAVIDFAGRFAKLATAAAARESDAARAAELRTIARVCRRVPARRARNFHEALQSAWFCYLAMTLEQSPNAYAFSVGRLDQWCAPLLEADLAAGRLDEECALELLECLWIKFVVGPECWAVSQNILVGGTRPDGGDACNRLTLLCLEASRRLHLPQPSVAVRLRPDGPPALLAKTAEVMAAGMGLPAVHNDATVIATMLGLGYAPADARNYCIAGCQEFVAEGCDNSRTTGGKFNLLKCLELALNDGVSTVSGRRLGPATGRAEEFDSYERVWAAFAAQVRHFVTLMVESHNRSDRLLAEERPAPFLSGIMGDCLAKGADWRSDGARYNFSGCLVHGLGSTTDALAALKTLVFDRGEIAMGELVEALRRDFRDAEPLRLRLLRGAPKFGNGDAVADRIAAEVFAFAAAEIQSRANAWGGRWRAGFNTPSTHVHYGRTTGATPDGRRAGEPMSYGTGPADGRTQRGPTAVARSVAAFDHRLATLGTDLGFSFHPTAVAGDTGRARLADFIRTVLDLGAHHLQVNVAGVEELRAAQTHPEAHADLVVRVHGFSTRFVALERCIQDDLIHRLESAL